MRAGERQRYERKLDEMIAPNIAAVRRSMENAGIELSESERLRLELEFTRTVAVELMHGVCGGTKDDEGEPNA